MLWYVWCVCVYVYVCNLLEQAAAATPKTKQQALRIDLGTFRRHPGSQALAQLKLATGVWRDQPDALQRTIYYVAWGSYVIHFI
jgi:hypothetical protein